MFGADIAPALDGSAAFAGSQPVVERTPGRAAAVFSRAPHAAVAAITRQARIAAVVRVVRQQAR